MKNGSFIVKLVFGIMGVVYSIIGLVCLTIAQNMAGDIRRIFRLPQNDLGLAIVGTVFGALGVIFLLMTVILLLAGRKQKRLREELLAWGQRVQGEIVDVRVNRSIQVNGRSPLVAQVRVSFPRGDVTLKSKNLWNARPSTGDKVDVLYDPMDERRYVIEFPDKE